MKAAGICETFRLGVAVHSSGELGIQLATMPHPGAVIPNLTFAADAWLSVADILPQGQIPEADAICFLVAGTSWSLTVLVLTRLS